MKEKINEFKEKISEIEKQISLLSVQKENLIKELSSLSQESNIQPFNASSDSVGQPVALQFSIAEKIKLFHDFFHGRNDVYARLWKSKKTGKVGYSPVCRNEWIRGICKKPQLKCSECPNRELVSIDGNVIYNHLVGKQVIGIYPMLQNETCYFLAIDFDKTSWRDDAFAFKETCLREGIPVSVERSRSGNGAHVWIFFKDEVPAVLARKLGTFLISKTMNRRYQLDMQSYDRLFPNQDTLPQGGFGNLIALPFQKEATRQENSIFIDDNCTPYFDQWGFLSSLEKMSLLDVEKLTKEAAHRGQIIGARMSPTEEKDPPWMLLPSGRKRYKPNISNLPKSIDVVVANRIYIKTDKVPSILLNQLKQLAAFQNPEFYKRQNMRFSTFATPRIICCAEILDGYLALPRGCFEDVNCLLNEHGVQLNIRNESILGEKVNFKFHGSLVKAQKKSLQKILKKNVGIFVAPPGSGKTVVAINVIAMRKTNTLILVHRKPLMEQWRLQLASFLNMDIKEIGRFGSGNNNMMGNVDIAMIQSMERKGVVNDRIAEYGFIVVDECHHIGAVSFERVLAQAKAKYV
ncbi:MAG: DEAD/DEAH box helicase family protein, partial [Candidatus Omnitrophota bacterium]